MPLSPHHYALPFLPKASCALILAMTLAACGGGDDDAPATSSPPPVSNTPPPVTAPVVKAGVSVYPTKLAMPGLDRTRGIRIYLPPGYENSTKRYPVIYMHDGQNLFDEATAQAGEWQVDETMDALAKEGVLEAIVVGIDRGGEIGNLGADELRGQELEPFITDPATKGKSDAKAYMNFVVNVVKPLVDKEYRTLPDRANTAIAGASLGGLISYYGINEYPQVFGRAIMFSSSFPNGGPEAYAYLFQNKVPPRDARLYFEVGGAEDPGFTGATKMVYDRQLAKGHQSADIAFAVQPGAQHGEAGYRAAFKDAVKWTFAKPVAVDPVLAPASTAGPGVSVYPTRLVMPGLDRTRGLRIYIPPGYATSGKRYPVIYMQDGQDLFDDATASGGKGGEWQVDETMDALARSGQLEAIVVGIDSAGEPGKLKEDMLREREYMIFDVKTPTLDLPSQSRQYLSFVVNVVKPLIDKEYRTLPDRANTAVMGAELGGMISYAAVAEYPAVFGKVGLFSPRLDVLQMEQQNAYYLGHVPPSDTRISFMTGMNDDPMQVGYDLLFINQLPGAGHNAKDLIHTSDTSGAKDEALWRAGFKQTVLWLFEKQPATP